MSNTMDTQNDNLKFDPAESHLHDQLQRTMPVQPPADLADRIFAATVHALRDQRSGVIGHVGGGWVQWTGWRYAAAVGLIVFYAALWARPHVLPTRISDIELARVDHLIVDPQSNLDVAIDGVAQQLDAISNRMATTFKPATASTNASSLAHDLYQWETSSF